VLQEIRQMINDAGRAIRAQQGVDTTKPLDFGLEIVADDAGNAFAKGSLSAKIAITNNIEVGVAAVYQVLSTIHALRAPRKPDAIAPPATAKIINRLDRIAFVHQKSGADTKLAMSIPKAFRTDLAPQAKKTVTFGGAAIKNIVAMREPTFTEHGVTLYGRLVELKDRTQIEREGGTFWGELRRDNGDRWRIQFNERDQKTAVPLFRKQVEVTGDAYYYQARHPKLVASTIVEESPRDLLAAFNELYGIDRRPQGEFENLVAQRHE